MSEVIKEVCRRIVDRRGMAVSTISLAAMNDAFQSGAAMERERCIGAVESKTRSADYAEAIRALPVFGE